MAEIKKILEKIIEQIKEQGADSGQVFVTESENREFNAESGEFTLFRTLFNQDMNLIVYKDQKKGSYFTNKLDDESIDHAVYTAMTAMESSNQDEDYDIAPYQERIEAHKGIDKPDIELLFTRAKELLEEIKINHPLVVVSNMIVSYNKRHMVFANTNHTFCEEFTGSYAVSLTIAGHKGNITTSAIGCGACLDNLDKPFYENENIKKQIRVAEEQINMKPMEGKFTGTMVLTSESFSTFLWYIAGLVNGSVILDKTSIWIDKLNCQVADPRISIKFDPHEEHIVCGETLTFDGFKSEAYDFIKDGVLSNFIIGYYISKKTGYRRAGNGGLNAIVTPGEESMEDIIKKIDKGIIVGSFSGGQPAINGDFSGVAKNSYLIEDGKITGPVTEVMVNGNLADMLFHLVGISKEMIYNGCDVLPYMIAFDGILVSGK